MPNYDVLIYRNYNSGNANATEGAQANNLIPDLPDDVVIAGVYAPLHESKDATVVAAGRVGLPEGLRVLLKSRGPS